MKIHPYVNNLFVVLKWLIRCTETHLFIFGFCCVFISAHCLNATGLHQDLLVSSESHFRTH